MANEVENNVLQLIQLCKDLQALARDAEPLMAQSRAIDAVINLRKGWEQAADALAKIAVTDDVAHDLPTDRSWSSALSALFYERPSIP